MLKFTALFFVFGIVLVSSQNWRTNSYVLNHEKFFTDVIEETILELERREWCNLKLDDIYQTIYDSLYNFMVDGTVIYSNGFLVSIQNINVVQIQQSLIERTVDGVTTTFGVVSGTLNLNDAMVGFDVEATLNIDGEVSVQRYTGTYNHSIMQFSFQILKNLETEEITVSSTLANLGAGSGVRMIYMPANNVTEALSRRWIPGNNFSSVGRWGSVEMASIMRNITINMIPFPDICIGCYA